jgi:hypothetical protein
MASQRLLLLLLALSTLWYVSCLNARFTTTIATTHRARFLGLHGLQMARDDEDRTKGIKSAAAGALAGGLIAGPVGAVLGFAVGDMMGGAKQTKSAQTDPAIRQAQALAADLGAAIEEAKNTKQQQENLLQQRKLDLSRFQAEADKPPAEGGPGLDKLRALIESTVPSLRQAAKVRAAQDRRTQRQMWRGALWGPSPPAAGAEAGTEAGAEAEARPGLSRGPFWRAR